MIEFTPAKSTTMAGDAESEQSIAKRLMVDLVHRNTPPFAVRLGRSRGAAVASVGAIAGPGEAPEASRGLAPACHHRRDREAVHDNRGCDCREGQPNGHLPEFRRESVRQRKHQVVDRADPSDAEPAYQRTLTPVAARTE